MANSLRILVRVAASPAAPSPRSGESWGKNGPGDHYKGRSPVYSPPVIHALARTSAHENDFSTPIFIGVSYKMEILASVPCNISKHHDQNEVQDHGDAKAPGDYDNPGTVVKPPAWSDIVCLR